MAWLVAVVAGWLEAVWAVALGKASRQRGIDVAQAPSIGWSVTTLPASTAVSYAAVLDDLATALVAWRRPERHGTRPSNNGVSARRPCGRRIRVTESVLAAGPITCGLCHG